MCKEMVLISLSEFFDLRWKSVKREEIKKKAQIHCLPDVIK